MRDLGQIGESLNLGRIVLGHDHDRQIACEDPGLGHQALGRQRLHVLPVGRGEHIHLGALFDLHAKILAAGEVKANLEVRVLLFESQRDALENFSQRRRREHSQLLHLGGARGGRKGLRTEARDYEGNLNERAPIHTGTSVIAVPVRAV